MTYIYIYIYNIYIYYIYDTNGCYVRSINHYML